MEQARLGHFQLLPQGVLLHQLQHPLVLLPAMRQLIQEALFPEMLKLASWEPPVDNGGIPLPSMKFIEMTVWVETLRNTYVLLDKLKFKILPLQQLVTFTLGYNGATTSDIMYNASASTVKTEIESLVVNGNAIFYPAIQVSEDTSGAGKPGE